MTEPTASTGGDRVKAARDAARKPGPAAKPPADTERRKLRRNRLWTVAVNGAFIYVLWTHPDLPWWGRALACAFIALDLILAVFVRPAIDRGKIRRAFLAREQVHRVRRLNPDEDPSGFGIGNLCDALAVASDDGKLTTAERDCALAGATFAIERVRQALDGADDDLKVPDWGGKTFGMTWSDTAGDDGLGGYVAKPKTSKPTASKKPETASRPGICMCGGTPGGSSLPNPHRHGYGETCRCSLDPGLIMSPGVVKPHRHVT
jgi:hypothetical protein